MYWKTDSLLNSLLVLSQEVFCLTWSHLRLNLDFLSSWVCATLVADSLIHSKENKKQKQDTAEFVSVGAIYLLNFTLCFKSLHQIPAESFTVPDLLDVTADYESLGDTDWEVRDDYGLWLYTWKLWLAEAPYGVIGKANGKQGLSQRSRAETHNHY